VINISGLPEDGQELRRKHFGSIINNKNTVQQLGIIYFAYNVVVQEMYSVKSGLVFRLLLVQISAAMPSAFYLSVFMLIRG